MEDKNKLVIQYIDRIRDEFLKRGHLINDNTYNKIIAKYKDSRKPIEEIKSEIDLLVLGKIERIKVKQEKERLKKERIENYQDVLLTLKSMDKQGFLNIIQSYVVTSEKKESNEYHSKVRFGSKNGVFKNNGIVSNAVLDKLEFIICQIGKMFDINVAETYKVYKDSTYIGIISENVCNYNETLYTFNELTRFVDSNDSDIQQLNNELERLKNKKNKLNKKKEIFPIVDSKNDILIIINSFLSLLNSLKITEENKRTIKEEYFKMLMLDFIVNNVDRSHENYGLIISEYGEVKFSPLFNNSMLEHHDIPYGYQQINGFLINKIALLNCLYEKYYDEIKRVASNCLYNKEDIIVYIKKISKNELDSDENEWFINIIIDNINMIIEKEQSRNNNEPDLSEIPKLVRTKSNLNNQGKINLVYILLSISLILIFTTLILLFKIS